MESHRQPGKTKLSAHGKLKSTFLDHAENVKLPTLRVGPQQVGRSSQLGGCNSGDRNHPPNKPGKIREGHTNPPNTQSASWEVLPTYTLQDTTHNPHGSCSTLNTCVCFGAPACKVNNPNTAMLMNCSHSTLNGMFAYVSIASMVLFRTLHVLRTNPMNIACCMFLVINARPAHCTLRHAS